MAETNETKSEEVWSKVITPIMFILNNRILLSFTVFMLTLFGGSTIFFANLPDRLDTIEAKQTFLEEGFEKLIDVSCYTVRGLRTYHPESNTEPIPEVCKL